MTWDNLAHDVLEAFATVPATHALNLTDGLSVMEFPHVDEGVDVSAKAVARARRAIDRAIAERAEWQPSSGVGLPSGTSEYYRAYTKLHKERIRTREIKAGRMTGLGQINRPSPMRDAILRAIRDGAHSRAEILAAVVAGPYKATAKSVSVRLSMCAGEGLVVASGERGHYRYELTAKARAIAAVAGR